MVHKFQVLTGSVARESFFPSASPHSSSYAPTLHQRHPEGTAPMEQEDDLREKAGWCPHENIVYPGIPGIWFGLASIDERTDFLSFYRVPYLDVPEK